jgi:RNA polymerase sigma-70 factor (ECF subfamily)
LITIVDSEGLLNSQRWQALIDGDEEVFRELFHEFQPRLYRFLWLRLKSVEAAEDLAQECFLRLWNARTRLQLGGRLDIYLFRIASNLATDYHRSAKHRHDTLTEDNSPPISDSSENAAEYNQLAAIVDKTISQLPPAPRTAFILSRYENLSHKEIAEIMGISFKTVEKHVGKALKVLKDALFKLDKFNLSPKR